MEQKQHNKRKIIFVDKSFQTKFILRIYGITLIAIILLAILFLVYSKNQFALNAINRLIDIRNSSEIITPLIIKITLIVAVIALLLVSYQFSIYSHKIIGPLYRFKRIFGHIKNGDMTTRIQFREKDELKEVAVLFSDMMEEIHKRLIQIKEEIAQIRNKTRKKDIKKTELAEISKLLETLSKKINYFKL